MVVRHEVTYLKPLTYDFRPVSIECWVTDIKAATFTMAYEIFHDTPSTDGADGDRIVYLRATTVLTPFVFAEERPRRITPEERETLERHLEPDQQPRRRTPPLPDEVTSHYPIHVRFSDVDVYGHVNNVKYFEYLQEARISMIARAGAAAPVQRRGRADRRRLPPAAAVPGRALRLPVRRSPGSAPGR